MFKRLYWQGYKGRFGSFRWPTFSKWPSVGGEGGLLNHYDRSEWQAWKSGIGLRNLLTRLNTMYPGQVRLSAHSMGNIVAGEALRIPAGSPPLVQVYAAMQAAVPAHSYDPTRTFAPDNGTPNVFAQYWAAGSPCYFNAAAGAAAYVNFYNPVDAALSAWTIYQNFKPDEALAYAFHIQTSVFTQYHNSIFVRNLTFPANVHEIFSFLIEGRCFALGAQFGVTGGFDSDAEVLLDPTYAFGDRVPGHSGQFRTTNMKRAAFWNRFVDVLDVIQP